MRVVTEAMAQGAEVASFALGTMMPMHKIGHAAIEAAIAA